MLLIRLKYLGTVDVLFYLINKNENNNFALDPYNFLDRVYSNSHSYRQLLIDLAITVQKYTNDYAKHLNCHASAFLSFLHHIHGIRKSYL